MRLSIVGCVFFCTQTACIVEAPGGSSHSSARRALSQQAAPLKLSNGANLGGKVQISSVQIDPGMVLAGESFKVVTEFLVLEKMDIDYTVFVHVEDASGRGERMNADHLPVNGRVPYPTTAWKPGETVRDEFTVFVPSGRTGMLTLYLGLWDSKTDARLPLKNPEAVRNDGNHRILVAQVPVG